MRKLICLILIGFIFFSCAQDYQKQIKNIIENSPNSGWSSDTFFEYCGNDEEKLKAIHFLLTNIDSHYSNVDTVLSIYADSLALLSNTTHKSIIYRIWNNIIKEYESKEKVKQKDSESLSPDYLIDNTEHAFNTWRNSSWKNDVSFDIFCKYILPYRVGTERLSKQGWRDTLYNRYSKLIEGETDVRKAFYIINDHIIRNFRNTQPLYDLQVDALTIDKVRPGNCDLRCILTVSVLRSLGIPAAYDLVPFWANYSTVGHSWVSLPLGEDITYSLMKKDTFPIRNNQIDGSLFYTDFPPEVNYPARVDSMKFATKVYRKTYEKQFSQNKISHSLDVSSMYRLNTSIKVSDAPIKEGVASLEVFLTGKDWIKISSQYVKKHKVSFEDLGSEIVYRISYTEDAETFFHSSPFLLQADGTTTQFVPDTLTKRQLVLYRKYPLYVNLTETWSKMIGCVVEGSDYMDFRNAEILYTVESTPFGFPFHEVNPSKAYRYIRYKNTTKWATALAEFELYDSKKEKIVGRPIGSIKDERILERAFDGDRLSFTTSRGEDYWIGLDLGNKPMKVGFMRFLPKNDANFVEPGHVYELFWMNTDGWHSLGEIVSEGDSLIYDFVPGNVILRLRDWTKGKEERIFSYEDGQQIWY